MTAIGEQVIAQARRMLVERESRHRTAMGPEPPRPVRLDVIEGSNLMKLYFAPHACSLSPHIVLRELGLPFERKRSMIHALFLRD